MANQAAEAFGQIQLAFQIPVGPMNQISIPVKSLSSAAYLATKSIAGWLKSRENSACLTTVLECYGTTLANAHTFDPQVFRSTSQDYPIHGVSIETDPNGNGVSQMLRCVLPKASSRCDGGPGMMCLRGLITGLTCLFPDKSPVIKILAAIVPKYLLTYDQVDVSFEEDGPLIASLRHLVSSILVEERNNNLYEIFLRDLDVHRRGVTGATLSDLANCEIYEESLAIEFLSWLLTPPVLRDDPKYRESFPNATNPSFPTISFRVWALAFVLGRLGFDVSASNIAIGTDEMYQTHIAERKDISDPARVFLITQTIKNHNIFNDRAKYKRYSSPTLRRVPIKSIPDLVFDQYCYFQVECDGLNEIDLVSIFNATFEHITEQLQSLACIQEIKEAEAKGLKTALAASGSISTYQRAMMNDWLTGPMAERLLSRPLQDFLYEECPDQCGRSPCHYTAPYLEGTNAHNNESNEWKSYIRQTHTDFTPWIKMHIIMLAFAYAVACQYLRSPTGAPADLNTEVILTSIPFFNTSNWADMLILIPNGDLRYWVYVMASTIGIEQPAAPEMLIDPNSLKRVQNVIYHMVCGVKLWPVTKPNASDSEASLGCCKNGLTLLSKSLVNPTPDSTSTKLYYLSFGHILQVPVMSDGRIIASSRKVIRTQKREDIRPTRVQDNRFQLYNLNGATKGIMWSPEPDWELNEMHAGLRCRVDNIPKFIINPLYVTLKASESFNYERVECSFLKQHNLRDIENIMLPVGERWFELTMREIYCASNPRVNFNGDNESLTLQPGETWNILIRAGKKGIDQAMAINTFRRNSSLDEDCIYYKFLSPCLQCTMGKLTLRRQEQQGRKRGKKRNSKTQRYVNVVVLST